jgi:hypothetical protein
MRSLHLHFPLHPLSSETPRRTPGPRIAKNNTSQIVNKTGVVVFKHIVKMATGYLENQKQNKFI